MSRLTIDDVIGHCNRHTERTEKHMSRETLENMSIEDNTFMKEYWEHRQVAEWLKELQALRDKQEQGLLIELPCKVGSKVYLICARRTKCTEHGLEFDDYFCEGCECLECDSRREYYIHENYSVSIEWIVRYLNDFGVRVFLTESEAEEALAKTGGK